MSEQVAVAEYDVGRVAVEMPYEAELIQRIKDEIEVSRRSWDPSRKMWLFADEIWDQARDIIEDYFPVVD